jgi:hypothetical protein
MVLRQWASFKNDGLHHIGATPRGLKATIEEAPGGHFELRAYFGGIGLTSAQNAVESIFGRYLG